MQREAKKAATPAALEKTIQRDIMVALGALDGVCVHRNNVGRATYFTREGNPVRVEYGVGGVGAPDLLVEVFHEPTGHWLAAWLEVKTPVGAVRPDQKTWHAAARMVTRIAPAPRNVAVVRSVADALGVVAEIQAHGRVVSAWGIPS